MRIEEILAVALEKVGNDRYILSLAVGQRADELSKGAKPLLDNSLLKNMKYTDIAILEIAKGLLNIEGFVEEN
ncbi:MAG TPA: DNA-directed RNA polymerase subunit omega [Arcobacter sp.]|nr:DNA-directed RNA polymerase subunit omega [Arcobacter sp.]HIP55600.1 DNA-directed RNA polymerase subunit omega [Arcobacter sp.]